MSLQFPDYGILYVDDEQKSLKYFCAIFDQIAPIYTADSPAEGYRIFVENHEQIGLVLSDKKMPGESGIELLGRIQKYDSRPLRFLVTAYADLDLAVECLNDGRLYSYLSKPWDPVEMEHRMIKGMRHFCLTRERERLVQEKTVALQQLLMADKAASMGILSSGLNHHLRNSLTVLKTFYDMLPYQLREELGSEPKDSAFWQEFYGEVGNQMNRMTKMLANLAEGAEGGMVTRRDPIQLDCIVRGSAELVFQNCPQISVHQKIDADLIEIYGDAQKVCQMTRLLFQEAVSAVGEKGNIEIGLSNREMGDGVRLELLNDAYPMPEEDLKHLFDPFFVRSQNPEDLGTNLLACYLTVFHHGGTINAFRAKDGRNGIEVSLPLQPPLELMGSEGEELLNRGESPLEASKPCDTTLHR